MDISKFVKQFIEDYKQANNILDELEHHQYNTSLTLPERVAQLEQSAIRDALYANDGNRSAAAKELGISRELLHYKIKKYKING